MWEKNMKVMNQDSRFFYKYEITDIEDDKLLTNMEDSKIQMI
jgi:hypothetical protein